jgi:predicted DNA-binding transcriptional regulator AlpA
VHHLVGSGEIAEMLGVSRQRVSQLTKAPDWPAPVVVLGLGAVWHTEDIRAWAEEHGRAIRE